MADRVSVPRTSEAEGSRVVVTWNSVPEAVAAGGDDVRAAAARWTLGEDRVGCRVEDRVEPEAVPDELLDQLDLAAVGRVRLDQEVMDLGRDRVRVVRRKRREQPRLPDRVDHLGARLVATG